LHLTEIPECSPAAQGLTACVLDRLILSGTGGVLGVTLTVACHSRHKKGQYMNIMLPHLRRKERSVIQGSITLVMGASKNRTQQIRVHPSLVIYCMPKPPHDHVTQTP
jgi:hypothetical protein